MLDFELIGNLGQDAVVRESNGRKFVSLSVSHNESYTKEDGTRVDNVSWVSCSWEGDGGKMLPYLKKGQKVFVRGRGTTRLYSSEKERRMIAGINISIRQLELLGGAPDGVPHYLYDRDGVQHTTQKYYFCIDAKNTSLFDMAGREYLVDPNGWILPPQPSTQQAEDAATTAAEQPQGETPADGAETDGDKKKLSTKKKDNKNGHQEPSEYNGF